MLIPLLFLIYVNDLHGTSACINPILFVDDSNSFCSSKDTKTLFETMNAKLSKKQITLMQNKKSRNLGSLFNAKNC